MELEIASKDSIESLIASGLQTGKETESNSNCSNCPDLELRIETLLDEIKIKDDELQRHQKTIESFTSSLQESNGKKSILQKDNVKLKSELMTLKHVKLREDKELNDTIIELKQKLNESQDNQNTESLDNQKDVQIQKLKELIVKKNNDIYAIQQSQKIYVDQFKKVEELMKKWKMAWWLKNGKRHNE